MLSVNNEKLLYLPLYRFKANGMLLRFKVEDCKKEDEEGHVAYIFPQDGYVEEYFRFREMSREAKKLFDKELTWKDYYEIIKDHRDTPRFEVLNLGKYHLTTVVHTPESSNDKQPLVLRNRSIYNTSLHFRSAALDVEERFQAAMMVLNDIPKAIDVALRSMAYPGFKGNYAVIDLETWFNKGKLKYTLA